MWESSARPFTHRLVQETIIQWLIDPAFRLLGERIMSKNVVAVTFAERVQISLEFSPCLSYFFFFNQHAGKPRGVFKTERNTASPKSLALTFTTDALESTGQQMGTDASPEYTLFL